MTHSGGEGGTNYDPPTHAKFIIIIQNHFWHYGLDMNSNMDYIYLSFYLPMANKYWYGLVKIYLKPDMALNIEYTPSNSKQGW